MGIFRSVGRQFTRPVTHVAKSVKSLGQTAMWGVSTFKETRQSLVNKAQEPEVIEASKIINPRARFDFLHKENGWTEQAIGKRAELLKKKQRIALAFAFAGTVVAGVVMGLGKWGPIFGSIMSVLLIMAVITMFAIASRQAHMRDQLRKRSLITYKQFMSDSRYFIKVLRPDA